MRSFLFAFILFMLAGFVNAAAASPPLKYLVREPVVKTAHPPLLILMHGMGSNERDMFSLAAQVPPQYLVVSARAPFDWGNGGYVWYHADFTKNPPVVDKNEEEQSREAVLAMMSTLKEKYPFDQARVFLCGFSQGAIMSYGLALTHPDKIKGIAVMSGRIPEEVKPMVAGKDKLKGLEVFISHGTNDKVITVDKARTADKYLEALGTRPEYHEYPDVHTIDEAMLRDLISWLAKRVK